MEHARIFVAILLSFVVFFVWELFFMDREGLRQTGQAPAVEAPISAQTAPVTAPTAASGNPSDGPVTAVPLPSQRAGALENAARRIQVENRFYRLEIDEIGGSIKRVELKDYRQEVTKDAKPYLLLDPEVPGGSSWIGMKGEADQSFQSARFKADTEAQQLNADQGPVKLVLRHMGPSGLQVEKIYSFTPDSYLIQMDVLITNGSGQPITGRLYSGIRQRQAEQDDRYGFTGPSALIDGKLKQIDIDDIDEQGRLSGKIGWIAVQNRYFLSAVAPVGTTEGVMELAYDEQRMLSNVLLGPVQPLLPGQTVSAQYQLFFGPKRMDILKQYGLDLERVIDFGMFDFIAKPCLWFMNWVYGFLPNYGIAIILLTLLTKILLWPLGNKSYKSMNDMRRMQPLMAEIREKYKNDKKRMNEEMMNLYRVYKINPLGGCLPMLVQLPVFFALYRMLYEAIELRHAPFFAWINDLSAPDRLFSFNISVPLMEPPYGIPVLTLVMGATMFLQQKMTPTPGDPTQAKMMTFMPIIFTVIFVNFSSGLVLYWLINNVVSIGQQYYIYKKYA